MNIISLAPYIFILLLLLLPLTASQWRPNRRPRRPKSGRSLLGEVQILHHPQTASWNTHPANSQELKCRVSGPLLFTKVRWEKDGKSVVANERITVDVSRNRGGPLISTLRFKTVQKSDRGNYICVAESNKHVARSDPAVITITGPPNVNSISDPLPKAISVGWQDSFLVLCDGIGPPSVTKVIWNYKAFSDDKGSDVVLDGRLNKRVDRPGLRTLPREDDARNKNVVRYEVYCTSYSNAASETSATTIIHIKRQPDRPIINRIAPLGLGRVATLNWKPGFDGFDKVLGCTANLRGKNVSQTVTLGIPGKEENVKYLANLVPLNSYKVRIKCRNSVGSSEWTEERFFTTKEGFPDQAPRNVTVNAVNATTINATWLSIEKDHVFGVLLGYRVKLLRNGKLVDKVLTLSPDILQAHFLNLTPGERYCVYVMGRTKVKNGDWSMPECVTLALSGTSHPPVIKSVKTDPGIVTFTYVDGGNKDEALRNCSIMMQDPAKQEYRASIQVSQDIAENIFNTLPPNTQFEAWIQCFTVTKVRSISKTWIFRTLEEKPDRQPTGLGLKSEGRMLQAFWDRIDVGTLNGNFTGYNVCITATTGTIKCDWLVNEAKYVFLDVLPKQTYTVEVASCTNAGCGPFAYDIGTTLHWDVSSTTLPAANGTPGGGNVSKAGRPTFVYVIIVVVILVIVMVVVAGLYFRRRKRKKAEGNGATVTFVPSNGEGQYDQVVATSPVSPSNSNTLNEYDAPLLAKRPLLSAETLAKLDGVKVSRDQLALGERLGKGEFGRVYKAKFKPAKSSGTEDHNEVLEVAVKTMIMEDFDVSEREEFVKEGLRMKDLDHPNVMSLIGICLPEEGNSPSAPGGPRMSGYEAISPLVIVPYMANGDLKHYLYTARINDEAKQLTLNSLLRFACDIANGMEYLASRNIVHRDLACRNCMLNVGMRVVVSDFGLSRQIYSNNYYRQKRAAKMPVKWMALESLVDRIFTSATDVWAFGVTVWEIFSFCQSPYPGVQNQEMHELLKAGTRLKRPKNCLDNIWNDAIYPCWDPRPEERPTFPELVDLFTGYLKSHPVDGGSEASLTPVYVNVRPSEEYEDAPLPSDSLLHNDEVTISSEVPMERLPSGKIVQSQGRDRSSSKRPLLN